MSDEETLAVYAAQTDEYAAIAVESEHDQGLARFIQMLPEGGQVLDWGCGIGNAAAYLRDQGYSVTATDASPEFAAKASELFGLDVRVETFAELTDEAAYDGIWASFSLLHDRKSNMAERLSQAKTALRPGGTFALFLKVGDGERRDEIGRFYAFYQEDELDRLLVDAGFTVMDKMGGDTMGLDGVLWPWIGVFSRA